MKTAAYRLFKEDGQPLSDYIFSEPLKYVDGSRVGTIIPHQKELVYREAAEAAIDATREEVLRAERERDGWIETATQFHRGLEYYQGIVRAVGALFGPEAYTSDDGSVQDEVLAEKVFELAQRRFGGNRLVRAWHALMGR